MAYIMHWYVFWWNLIKMLRSVISLSNVAGNLQDSDAPNICLFALSIKLMLTRIDILYYFIHGLFYSFILYGWADWPGWIEFLLSKRLNGLITFFNFSRPHSMVLMLQLLVVSTFRVLESAFYLPTSLTKNSLIQDACPQNAKPIRQRNKSRCEMNVASVATANGISPTRSLFSVYKPQSYIAQCYSIVF